jgi:hypothetical protein
MIKHLKPKTLEELKQFFYCLSFKDLLANIRTKEYRDEINRRFNCKFNFKYLGLPLEKRIDGKKRTVLQFYWAAENIDKQKYKDILFMFNCNKIKTNIKYFQNKQEIQINFYIYTDIKTHIYAP